MSAFESVVYLILIGYLLPLLFLFNTLYIFASAACTGDEITFVIENMIVIDDDIDLPSVTGSFKHQTNSRIALKDVDYTEDTNEDASSIIDNYCSSDVSSVQDDSILPATPTVSHQRLQVPTIIITDEFDEQILIDYGRPVFDIVPDDLFTVKAGLLPSVGDLYSFSSLIDTDSISMASLSSLSSLVSIDLTEQCTPSRNSSSTCYSSDAPSLGLSTPVNADEELDLTEEEESILEGLCLKPPVSVSAAIHSGSHKEFISPNVAAIPAFSRHNIGPNVVFPVRKNAAASVKPVQFDGPAKVVVGPVLQQISATWVPLSRQQGRSSVVHDQLSRRLSSISERSFVSRGKQTIVMAPQCDPYDSWPWIGAGYDAEKGCPTEQVWEAEEEEEGEESFGTVFKAALDYFKF
ncbi:hypothetical protein AMATHDRAFT_2210 [Amanita thiersii Skay4041]|uniref:Uncharacterized protein n=1 Tax=Amanita thiersii Skay4041 TaxID=703135 RepID=A0A2A9NXJ0_9AGAR|nr:hypothetical protein AMATHDRAFT_2210 [Amanita thiersii Skay4041]